MITAAAAIMVVVFLAFLATPDVFLKLFGIGLAAAVFLDATIVRMVLVPAVMQLLGARNWWIPNWLERVLPRLDVERGARAGPALGRMAVETQREDHLGRAFDGPDRVRGPAMPDRSGPPKAGRPHPARRALVRA